MDFLTNFDFDCWFFFFPGQNKILREGNCAHVGSNMNGE